MIRARTHRTYTARTAIIVAEGTLVVALFLLVPQVSSALQQPAMYTPYCMSGGTQVQLTWGQVSGASNYPLRVDGAGYCAGNVSGPGNWGCYQGVEYLYETAYSGIVLSIVPNTSYTWWVHGQNGGAWSPATAMSFSCSPPPPSCTAQYACSGNYQIYQSSSCSTSYIQYCSYGCSNGSCNPPPAPSEPSASASCYSNGDVNISWGSSSGASYYALRVNNTNTYCNGVSGPDNNVGCVSGTDYVEDNISTSIHSRTVTPSPGGSPVTYWVHGVNSAGWSTNTQRSITCTPALPSEPTGQTTTCSADGTSVRMSWDAVDAPNLIGYPLRLDDTTDNDNGCSIAPYYHSWYCNAPTELAIDWQSPYQNQRYNITATSYTAPVVPGRAYRWWVHSLTHQSGSPDYWWSSTTPHTFTCAAAPICTLTTNAAVISASSKNAYWGSNTGVTFSWTTQNANSFSIYPAPTTMWMTPVSSGSWQYGPINQTATFTGTATNGSGVGGNCTATVTVPTEPVGYSHTCSADGTQATLSWGTSSGATSYALRVDNRNIGSACNGITGVPNNKNGGCWQQYWPYSSAYGYTGNPGYTDYIEDNIPLSTHSKTVTISPAGSPVTWWVHGVSPKNAPFTGYTYNTATYLGYAYSDFTFTTFTCAPAAPTCSVTLSPNPASYSSTGTAILTWSATNADTSVYINNVGYLTGSSGSFTVPRTATTDYSCTVVGPGGTDTETATLTVTPPALPIATLDSSRGANMQVGQTSTITATFAAASNDTLTHDNIDSPLGTGLGATTNPDATKTYTFSPNGPGTYTFYARATTGYYTSWTTYATLAITVSAANPACTLGLNPTTITRGQSSALSWTSTNTTGGTISGVGAVGPNGSTSVAPSQTTLYSGVFNGPGNSTAQCNDGEGVTLTLNCPVSYSCSGNTIVRTNTDCGATNLTTCASPTFCSAGSSVCLYPEVQFAPEGHLRVQPAIVPVGLPSQVMWDVANVASCTVTGTNGDAWTVAGSAGNGWTSASPSDGETTSPIMGQTTYTLTCVALDDTPVPPEEATVNVLPIFQEV